jgi:asparagine synthetase B (glutamine-hydrolysing)
MTGICGTLRFAGTRAAADDVRRQLAALAHRGPDGAHVYARGEIAVGLWWSRLSEQIFRFDKWSLCRG